MKTKINLILGDITKIKVDAIVNAANKTLLGGGGVDGMIHAAAGPRLRAECKALNGCETGQAKITNGYDLPAKYIIHTVGPVYEPDEEIRCERDLKSCYINCLNLLKRHNLHSIAFPSISTGFYGYPPEKASEIAINAVNEWLKNNEDYKINVIFCCYKRESYLFYKQKLL